MRVLLLRVHRRKTDHVFLLRSMADTSKRANLKASSDCLNRQRAGHYQAEASIIISLTCCFTAGLRNQIGSAYLISFLGLHRSSRFKTSTFRNFIDQRCIDGEGDTSSNLTSSAPSQRRILCQSASHTKLPALLNALVDRLNLTLVNAAEEYCQSFINNRASILSAPTMATENEVELLSVNLKPQPYPYLETLNDAQRTGKCAVYP